MDIITAIHSRKSIRKFKPDPVPKDIGAAMQNLCLAALNYDLGTCIEDQSVLYPEVLRKHASIPDTKRIVIAIAVGYPDWDFPANELISTRESIEKNTTWLGF